MAEVKGGRLARRAGMLCQERRFGLYLDQRRRQKSELTPTQLPDGTHTPEDCADWLRWACGVKSRAEIDHVAQARNMLARIVADYQRWERQQRGMV